MLDQDALTGALIDGQKTADSCGHFCRVGGTIDDGRYRVHHNGVGSRDTDAQVVHASQPLGMSSSDLATRLAAWIKKLHQGERTDLNAAMATGGRVSMGYYRVIGEAGPDLFMPYQPGTIIPNSRRA